MVIQRLRPVVVPDLFAFFQFGGNITEAEGHAENLDKRQFRIHFVGREETEFRGFFQYGFKEFVQLLVNLGRGFVIDVAVVLGIFGEGFDPVVVELFRIVSGKVSCLLGKERNAEHRGPALFAEPAAVVAFHSQNGNGKTAHPVVVVKAHQFFVKSAPVSDGQSFFVFGNGVLGGRRINTGVSGNTVIFEDL